MSEGGIGFGGLPLIVHKKQFRRGFDFTIMVVGESGLGKSTLIHTLFLNEIRPDRAKPAFESIKQTVEINKVTFEFEEKGVKLRLTIVDTPGFGDAVDNRNCWEQIIQYINEKYSKYLEDESGLNRKNIVDNRVHACLYFLNPSAHGLKPLDIEFMRELHESVNIIPVIAKADTLTESELRAKKIRVLREIRENGIKIYTGDIEDEEDNDEVQKVRAAIPLGIIGSRTIFDVNGKKVRGRLYPWGIVEVENGDHSDFPLLRNMLIRTHMQDLKDATQEIHYENYRKRKLQETVVSGPSSEVSTGNSFGFAELATTTHLVQKAKDQLLLQKDQELVEMKRQMELLQAQLRGQVKVPEDTTV
ncbi:Septin-1-like [Oopsacas minuta]|uniref:Septin n=1 Tax=Oopsacas minuta TaxID=111878 RepID=A0AAV7KB33_9METZ|nr:Septin-1-like [Oopsacas minuta]